MLEFGGRRAEPKFGGDTLDRSVNGDRGRSGGLELAR